MVQNNNGFNQDRLHQVRGIFALVMQDKQTLNNMAVSLHKPLTNAIASNINAQVDHKLAHFRQSMSVSKRSKVG